MEAFKMIQKEIQAFLEEAGFTSIAIPDERHGLFSVTDDFLYAKNERHLIHVVLLTHNFSAGNQADIFLKKVDALRDITSAFQKQFYHSTAIASMLFIDHEIKPYVSDFIEQAPPFFQDTQCLIPLSISLNDKKIHFNPDQPVDSFGLFTAIKKTLQEGYRFSEHVSPDNNIENEPKKDIDLPANEPSFPKVSISLMLINSLIFVFFLVFMPTTSFLRPLQDKLYTLMNIDPVSIVHYFENGVLYYHSHFSADLISELISSMFLHSGLGHLIANMMGIYIFGFRLEVTIGSAKTALLYMASGILGGLLEMPFLGLGGAVGASGALYGLVGASLAYTVVYKEKLLGLTHEVLLIYGILGFLSGFMSPNIAGLAHLGGFISGFILLFIYFNYKKRKKIT